MLKVFNKRKKRALKVSFLLANLILFTFPNFVLAGDKISNLNYIEGAKAEVTIKAYYDKPTLPEIPMRKARKLMKIVVTAYNSLEDQTDSTPFITAFGTRTRDGIVATNFLSRNTRVRFPEIYGDKTFIVEDRMHERYYYHLDIWMEKRDDALKFGSQVLTVEIL